MQAKNNNVNVVSQEHATVLSEADNTQIYRLKTNTYILLLTLTMNYVNGDIEGTICPTMDSYTQCSEQHY